MPGSSILNSYSSSAGAVRVTRSVTLACAGMSRLIGALNASPRLQLVVSTTRACPASGRWSPRARAKDCRAPAVPTQFGRSRSNALQGAGTRLHKVAFNSPPPRRWMQPAVQRSDNKPAASARFEPDGHGLRTGYEIRRQPLWWCRQLEAGHSSEHLTQHGVDLNAGDMLA